MDKDAEIEQLKTENARLRALFAEPSEEMAVAAYEYTRSSQSRRWIVGALRAAGAVALSSAPPRLESLEADWGD